jgi:hypothetical protein
MGLLAAELDKLEAKYPERWNLVLLKPPFWHRRQKNGKAT